MSNKPRSRDPKFIGSALQGVDVNYKMAPIQAPLNSRTWNASKGWWEASGELRQKYEKHVTDNIKGATSVKVAATVMTDATKPAKDDPSDPTNQIVPIWPKAAAFGPAAISYTLDNTQYLCVHGVELSPFPQFFLGMHATLSFDGSFGTANTTPLKDVVGGDAQGSIKKTIATYYKERLQGQEEKAYASFQDEAIAIIEKLDPSRPIVVSGHSLGAALTVPLVAQIRNAFPGKKLDISVINAATYKSADDKAVDDFIKAGIDATNYNVEGDPVTNMTGPTSFMKGIGDTVGVELPLSDLILAERAKSKTRDVGATYVFPISSDESTKSKHGIALHPLSLVLSLVKDPQKFSKFVRNDSGLDQSFVTAPPSGKPELMPVKQSIDDMKPFFKDINFDATL